MKRFRVAGIFLGLALLSASLRFPQLSLRPMHCDEAVHADKFGTLLTEGRYEYSPEEYHGPTLNYLTLIPARLAGTSGYADLSETILRLVPAVCGVLLVAAHALLVPLLGLPAAAAAGLFAAVSPAMVFYSRYYIQEMLLVLFTFLALLSAARYLLRPSAGWVAGCGAALGLMYATKETSVIAFFSLGLALTIIAAAEMRGGRRLRELTGRRFWGHLGIALATAISVASLFFSSFLSHPHGILDSVAAFRTYLERAGSNPWHIHPWHFYFDLLLYSRGPDGMLWSEGLILLLAVGGFLVCWRPASLPGARAPMLRVIGLYTLFMALIYSLIPYKTPWCLLGFWHGMILLAGVGVAGILYRSTSFCRETPKYLECGDLSPLFAAATGRSACTGPKGVRRQVAALQIRIYQPLLRQKPLRIAGFVALAAGVLHLGWQAWAASFRYEADPGNPYVYAHTTRDVFTMVQRVEGLARAHPAGNAMPIQVFSRENLWPLPWYLRRFSKTGWWNGVSDEAPMAQVFLATPDMEPALLRRLYELPPPGEREMYVSFFGKELELRPAVELRGYAAKSLWDDYQQLEAAGGAPSSGGRK